MTDLSKAEAEITRLCEIAEAKGGVVRRNYKFRIYPNARQEARLLAWEAALRFLWNLAHEQRLLGLSRVAGEKIFPSSYKQQKELTSLRAEVDWLRDVPYDACSVALDRLHESWGKFFAGRKGRPGWKRRSRDSVSISQPSAKRWGIRRGALRFPRIGWIRMAQHRDLAGGRTSCTIKRDGDQWFACIICEIDKPDVEPRTSPVVALDRGITYTLADSDGNLTESPKFYERSMKRLARAQRTVSRRKKGSANREKAKLRVMRLHRKVRRQREHFLHVESARLAKSHGVVVIEKLNVAGMVRGNLSRHIADAGWSKFATMLRYKLEWSGGSLVEVPAAYSSQTCAECGAVDAASRNRERFCCTSCGHVDHADLNAAKVLKSRWSPPVQPVEASA